MALSAHVCEVDVGRQQGPAKKGLMHQLSESVRYPRAAGRPGDVQQGKQRRGRCVDVDVLLAGWRA